jgi:hypothetical protein
MMWYHSDVVKALIEARQGAARPATPARRRGRRNALPALPAGRRAVVAR